MFDNSNAERCPLCQKKMKAKGSSLVCGDCGYVKNPTGDAYGQSYGTGYGSNQVTNTTLGSSTSHVPYNNTFEKKVVIQEYHDKSKNVKNPVSKQKNPAKTWALFMFASFGITTIISILGIVLSDGTEVENEEVKYVHQIVDYDEKEYPELDKIWEEHTTKTVEEPTFLLPRSELYRAFVKHVFGKEYDAVTEAEYGSVTYLYIDDYENIIRYALDEGEIQEYCYDNSLYGYSEDLSCFFGLKRLISVTDAFYEGDLVGLKELVELRCSNSPAELIELLECPEKIEVLELYDNYYGKTMEGIEKFTNLKYFYLDATYAEMLTGLDKLTKLEELVIEGGSSIKSFAEIGKLTSLKKFSIQAYNLKNLTIMDNMKDLEELSIVNTQVEDISVLGNYKDSLKKLVLTGNSKVDDMSVLSDMTKLEELQIECDHNSVFPDLSKLTGLKSVTVEGSGDLAKLSTLKSVEYLNLSDAFYEDLSVVQGLTQLKVLELGQTYNYSENIDALLTLTGLEKLGMSRIHTTCNVEALFALPNLKELTLENASVGIDFSKVSGSSTLEVLNLSNADICKYVEPKEGDNFFYYDYEDVEFGKESAFLAKFPNLKELYLEAMELEDIKFASELTKLEILDITNNNVSSLEPLAKLPNIKLVRCGMNTIGNDGGLGDKVSYE